MKKRVDLSASESVTTTLLEHYRVLVLCDPRLLSRSYGRVFLDSLPPMRRTRRLEQVQAFFAASPADPSPRPTPA